jgi:hypothetical protein
MALDDDFKTLMLADTPLMAILTGKAYSGTTDQKTVDGLTPDTAANAFTGQGKLKPCALVLLGAETPDGWVNDVEAQLMSTFQTVRISLYQLTGYDAIDAGIERLFTLFHGYIFPDGRQVECANKIPRLPREAGVLKNSSVGRIDFAVYTTRGATQA